MQNNKIKCYYFIFGVGTIIIYFNNKINKNIFERYAKLNECKFK